VRARLGAPIVLTVAVAVLLASGSVLSVPPWRGFGRWLDEVGAVEAAVSLARLAALAAVLVLLVLWAATAAAEAAGALAVAASIDRVLPPMLRRVLGGVAGVGVAGSVLVAAGSGPSASAADGRAPVQAVATMQQADVAVLQVEEPEATMQVVEEPTAPPPVDEWVVVPGDSFWSIAEEVVGERLGRPGSEAEVTAYWGRLVEANRPNLATGDPDLIYPGQRLELLA
jgi:nucleoid-associated protein YgaU